MRGLGFTRREAETIRCRGFNALSQGSDHEEQPDAKLVEELKALLHKRAAALAVKD